MQLPVQNQIPCAGSFGCQRIHVALNKHDDKLDRLEEICFMEKLITRKEAAEILGISMDIYAKVKYNRPDELVRTMGGAFAQWDAAQA